MVGLFTTAFAFSYPWPAQTYAVLNKYPNPLAPHVISIDVVDRSIMPDGTIRSERILGIQQDSPRWIRRVSLSLSRTAYMIWRTRVEQESSSSPFSSSHCRSWEHQT